MTTRERWVKDAKYSIQMHLIRAGLAPEIFDELVAWEPGFLVKAATKSNHHHAYEGGLVVHTAEVMDLIESMSIETDNIAVLMLAALYHDIGKIYEYSDDKEHGLSYRNLIGHVAGGPVEFQAHSSASGGALNAAVNSLTLTQRQNIAHCMLSHHGKKEWGAAVLPQTSEAFLLHRADMISARRGERKVLPDEHSGKSRTRKRKES